MTRGSIVRWNPNHVFNHRPEAFSRLFENVFGPLSESEAISNRAWMPAVDVRETESEFIVTAELAGLGKDDVEITFEDNVLRLSGERKFEGEDHENSELNGFHRIERAYGTFSRSFSLPTQVDGNAIDAAFGDGLLTVTLPKAEESRPRRISIK